MKTILKYKTKRNTFLSFCGLIICVLFFGKIIINYNFKAPQNEIIENIIIIIDKFITSLIVSITIGWFLFKIEVPDEESNLEVIEPIRISDSFDKGLKDTSIWYFSGGAGRYTRNVTLPKLVKKSGKSNKTITFKICIIDPKDKIVCKNYVNFKNSLNSSISSEFTWTEDFLKNQIYATIFKSIIYKSIYKLVNIEIYLKKTFTTTRIDLNDFNCIITKEDKRDFALSSVKDAFLYRTFKEEITQIANQSKKVTIKQFDGITKNSKINEELVQKIALSYNFKLEQESIKNITIILNEKKSIF